ncbi:MAG: UdgX family uracil-DNA binding protein [Actinomycetota bacterium]
MALISSPDSPVHDLVPADPDLEQLRDIAATCTGCPLYRDATQTVFGEGEAHADVMLVGEQPGDQEDLQGRPFVGPAGRLLHEALEESGLIVRSRYITNIVKHFKWVPRGKRRIHKKPNMREIRACTPWLESEIDVVKPRAIVALGATAAQGLLGGDFRVSRQRGELLDSPLAEIVMATVHPSSILRGPEEERRVAFEAFARDLEGVARALEA